MSLSLVTFSGTFCVFRFDLGGEKCCSSSDNTHEVPAHPCPPLHSPTSAHPSIPHRLSHASVKTHVASVTTTPVECIHKTQPHVLPLFFRLHSVGHNVTNRPSPLRQAMRHVVSASLDPPALARHERRIERHGAPSAPPNVIDWGQSVSQLSEQDGRRVPTREEMESIKQSRKETKEMKATVQRPQPSPRMGSKVRAREESVDYVRTHTHNSAAAPLRQGHRPRVPPATTTRSPVCAAGDGTAPARGRIGALTGSSHSAASTVKPATVTTNTKSRARDQDVGRSAAPVSRDQRDGVSARARVDVLTRVDQQSRKVPSTPGGSARTRIEDFTAVATNVVRLIEV